ncbi:MAG: alpha/beta hydrolase [Myxococcota bacterium]
MRTEELRLTAFDGTEIHVHHWSPGGDVAPRGAVQIAHGMAEHGGRYAPVAEALVGAGYLVWASDHRGHGRTARVPEELGHFADAGGWDAAMADVDRLVRHIAEAHPELPRCLLGHSMGSYMAQQYMASHPDAVQAVVLSGSNVGGGALVKLGRGIARAERLRQGPRGRSPVIQAMSFDAWNRRFKPNRTEFDWLSRDPAQVDAYVADPLCGFQCSNQLWIDLLDALDALGRRSHFQALPRHLPVHVIAGTEDPVSDGTKGLHELLDAYRKVGMTRVSHVFYEGARHEVFNETNRGQVLEELVRWLDASLEPAA